MKKAVFLFVLLIFVAFSTLACIGLDLMLWADRPADATDVQQVFSVSSGQRFETISKNLEISGLLTSPIKFAVLARFSGSDKRIQAGEYMLSPALSPRQLLAKLTKGQVRLYRLTVPEGYNLRQIATLVEQNGFTGAEDFYRTAADPDLLKARGIPADTFEAYLYPETYFFPQQAGPRQIIETMHRRFRSVFSEAWRNRARSLGFSVHQIVTLASIVEKETGTGTERPLIASVLHNRLKRGMRLEADPTVIYGIKNFNGNLTRKDLATRTPYNTYMIRGLPPGPIANPGYAALKAALYPADTRFLYFVAKKDRTHHFSTNFKDHRRAVRKYQLNR